MKFQSFQFASKKTQDMQNQKKRWMSERAQLGSSTNVLEVNEHTRGTQAAKVGGMA